MNRVLLVIVIVIIAGAVLLTSLGSRTVQKLQEGFLNFVSPVTRMGSAVQQQVGAMGTGLKTLDELEAENRELKTDNKDLRATLQIMGDLATENNRLRAALDYREKSVFQLMPAKIISRDASTWWNTVKINRGFEDGVESDQPVVTDVGLVGKTTTVGKNESLVLLVTDEMCKVAVKVEGTREQGIVSGMRVQNTGSSGEMQLNFLSKTANLQAGQKLYSAGVSNGVFPSGLFVGTVKAFQARELDGQAIVTPAVDPSSVEDVFVVVGAK